MPTLYLRCYPSSEVSEEDFDFLSGLNFHLNTNGYLRCTSEPYTDEYLHILVAKRMGLNIKLTIDHKDRIKINNKRNNLREATYGQNAINCKQRSDNTSRHRGVHWDENRQKWVISIWFNGKRKFSKRFEDYEEACRIRDEKELEYFGEFVNINR